MKNIKMLLGSLAIAAILGVNGYMAVGSSKAASELTLDDVENVAEGWELSDFLPGSNWWKYTETIYCDDYDYPWYYNVEYAIGSLKIYGVKVSLGAQKGGAKTVTKCGSGSGDCIASQSSDCVNW